MKIDNNKLIPLEGWREVKLGEVASVITGKTPKKKDIEYWGNTLDFITPTDYKDDLKYLSVVDRRLSKEGKNAFSRITIPRGSVIVTCIGSDMGKIAINKNDCVTNQQINSLVLNSNYSVDFIYYVLRGSYRLLRAYADGGGSTMPIINKSTFEKLQFFLPPLPEQKAIAEILSSLDDKIDLLHRQNKTLEDIAQTLFRQWFIEEAGEDWEEKPLDKIADYLNGLACQKHLPENELDKLPVLKIKELRNGFTEHSDWATSEVDEKYIIEFGDVIFSWSGSLMLKIWNGQNCVLNQHLFKVTSEKYPKWFYYFWTKHHLDKFIAIANSKATTMGHIKRGDLSNSLVLVPTSEELSKMNDLITPAFDKMISNQFQIRTLENLRDTLLPKLMSGEVRVSNNG